MDGPENSGNVHVLARKDVEEGYRAGIVTVFEAE